MKSTLLKSLIFSSIIVLKSICPANAEIGQLAMIFGPQIGLSGLATTGISVALTAATSSENDRKGNTTNKSPVTYEYREKRIDQPYTYKDQSADDRLSAQIQEIVQEISQQTLFSPETIKVRVYELRGQVLKWAGTRNLELIAHTSTGSYPVAHVEAVDPSSVNGAARKYLLMNQSR